MSEEAGAAAVAESSAADSQALPLRVIEGGEGRRRVDWAEFWQYRELLYFLVWRDVKVRYKQTVLGVAWALLQPLAMTAVFALFFGRWAGLGQKTGDVPYPLFVLTGLLPWAFFASAVTASSNSLVGSAQLLTKVYFPRLIIPFSTVGVALLDLGISLVILAALMLYYGVRPTWMLLLAPIPLLGVALVAIGVGTYLAALTVAYRDFRYVVPFTIQIWMFLSPVIYPSRLVPEDWRWLQALNPLTGMLDGLRACIFHFPVDWTGQALSWAITLLALWWGIRYFRRVERGLADVI